MKIALFSDAVYKSDDSIQKQRCFAISLDGARVSFASEKPFIFAAPARGAVTYKLCVIDRRAADLIRSRDRDLIMKFCAHYLTSCPSWQWHGTGSSWSPVRTLPVAPFVLAFVPNSCSNKAAANLRPTKY